MTTVIPLIDAMKGTMPLRLSAIITCPPAGPADLTAGIMMNVMNAAEPSQTAAMPMGSYRSTRGSEPSLSPMAGSRLASASPR